MQKNQQKKLAAAFFLIFILFIGGLLIAWFFIATKNDSDSSRWSDHPSSLEGIDSNISLDKGGLKTELAIIRERATDAIENVAKELLGKGLLDLDRLITLRKGYDQAVQYESKGNLLRAITLYQEVDRELRSLGNQQKFLEEATTLQGELLKKLRDLRSLRDWVEIPYDLALKASDDGSVLIENSEFEKATSAFKEGIRQMVELENVGNVILEQKLDKVRMLIQELKLDEALFKIKEVLSKFPEHNEASQMIVEIEKMRPYMGLIEGAKSLMQNNKFFEAMKMYDDLLVEMPSLKIAVEGRREAYDKYLQFTVRPLIEEAKASFEAEKYSESLALLEKAKSLAPEDKSIETAIEQVKEALERNRIRDMLAQALSYYNNGNWNQAKELYGKVLEQDPENVEAKKGSLESSKRHAELVLFEDSMGLAQSYYREKRFPKALEHFNNAVSRMPDYMSLTSYQQRMKDDLERQRFPVKVRVLSDGKTWASILGVLPPEKFKEKTIELYPDVYQLRGKRAGYQDFSLEYPLERRDGDEVILVIECVK